MNEAINPQPNYRHNREMIEQAHQAMKTKDETNKQLIGQLQKYGEAFTRLKAAYEKLKIQNEAVKSENHDLKAERTNLIEQNRRLQADYQNLANCLEMFSAELISGEAGLRDADRMISGVFGLDGDQAGQKGPSFDFDLTQTINSYSAAEAGEAAPVLAAFSAFERSPVEPSAPALVVASEGAESLITEEDLRINLDEMERELSSLGIDEVTASDKAA